MERQPMRAEFDPKQGDWDKGHVYAWRTWLRMRLPMVLIELGVAAKGKNCARLNMWHRWYTRDDETMACYHCEQIKAQMPHGEVIDMAGVPDEGEK